MNVNRIEKVYNWLRNLGNRQDSLNMPVNNSDVVKIHEELLLISKDIENEYSLLSNQLIDIKDKLFNEKMTIWNAFAFFINPFAFGRAIEVLNILKEQNISGQEDWWTLVHPEIKRVSKKLYIDGSYANAACDAFIEINDRVKKLFQKIRPGEKVPDGDAAMKTVFSANSPLIKFCDCDTDSGANIQKGFMEMLAGAMSALRNPKAHANIEIEKDDAMQRLIFASMLMYKIDEAVNFSGIMEKP